MSQDPARSPWTRRFLTGLAALLVLDAALLAAAANVPAVRDRAMRFAPALGSIVTAAASHAFELRHTALAPLAPLAMPEPPQRSPRILALASADGMTDHSFVHGNGEWRGFRYLFAEPAGTGESGWSMSGTYNNRTMSSLRSERTPFVWFGDDDGEYLVRDPDLVAAARGITQPMRELGAEMGRVGGKQGRLGAQQGRLGAKQGALGAKVGALSARRATAALAGEDAAGDRIDDEIEEIQRAIEEQSRELEARMRPLSEEMAQLGRLQAELGRRQERLSGAERAKMRELFERAKREGKAVRLHADA